MAQPTLNIARNDGSSTVVTVTLGGVALASSQANTRKSSYVQANGTSVEATVQQPGYTPATGQE